MQAFSFLKHFAQEEAAHAGQTALEALVAFDPVGASEAQIAQTAELLEKVSLQMERARDDYEREQSEADAIAKLYNQRLAAAHILEGDPSKEASLNSLLKQIEDMLPDVTREKQEATDAKTLFDELEQATRTTAENLRTARANLKHDLQAIQTAKVQKDRAIERAKQMSELAGIRPTTATAGIASSAMHKEAQRLQEETRAAQVRTKLLQPTSLETDDANVAAAMAQAAGGSVAPKSASARLAALSAQ